MRYLMKNQDCARYYQSLKNIDTLVDTLQQRIKDPNISTECKKEFIHALKGLQNAKGNYLEQVNLIVDYYYNSISFLHNPQNTIQKIHINTAYETFLFDKSKSKTPCVYFITNKYTGLTKIGQTSNISNRLSTLSSMFKNYFGVSDALSVDRIIFVMSGLQEKLESIMHDEYKQFRKFGEWFDLRGIKYTDKISDSPNMSTSNKILIQSEEYEYFSNMGFKSMPNEPIGKQDIIDAFSYHWEILKSQENPHNVLELLNFVDYLENYDINFDWYDKLDDMATLCNSLCIK